MLSLQFALILVIGIPGQTGQAHNLGITEITAEFLGEFSDHFFRFNAFPRDDDTVLLTTNLLPIQACGFNSFSGALVQILDFLFGLLKGQSNLLLGQFQQVTIDTFQDVVHIAAGQLNVVFQCLLIGLSIDVGFFQVNKVYPFLI